MEVLYEQFIREKQYLLNVSPRTVEGYRWAWKAMEPALKGKAQITKADVLARVAELRSKGLSTVTVNTYLRSINAFCHWMVQEGHVSTPLKFPRLKEDQKVLQTFSEAQVARLVSFRPTTISEQRMHTLVCLILDTGVRIDEALSIERGQDVDGLSAVRKLALEAADNGLMDAVLAQGIARAKGVKQAGTRTGNWLTADQAEHLVNAPDLSTLKGKRGRAILALIIFCGLRRSEVSAMTYEHVQQRDGRWAIVDLVGKGNRRRTVPMPAWAKVAIDEWVQAAGITTSRVFRPLNNRHEITGEVLLPQNIMEMVVRYGERIGVPKLAPHDLRRTFAKLAHRGRAALEQSGISECARIYSTLRATI